MLMVKVTLRGEQFSLLPERAMYWPAEDTLIVADLHWGKTAHFRKNGIAVPLHTQHADEAALGGLLEKFDVQRLIIAGDMFHSAENNEVRSFVHWRERYIDTAVHLVMGNHDILSPEDYIANNIIVHQEYYDVGPFLISHDEIDDPEKFYIHGHVHPSFAINTVGRHKNVKLPCFCSDEQRLILPSFGRFTGSFNIQQQDFDNIYVIADEEVIQWQ